MEQILTQREEMPRLWTLVLRGAIGGVLGVPIFIVYAIYRYPYGVVGGKGIPMLLLVTAVVGGLVGVIICLFGRVFRLTFGLGWRVILGMMLGSVLIAFYFYYTEGLDDDPKRLISNSLVLGSAVGGLAGTMAKGKRRIDK